MNVTRSVLIQLRYTASACEYEEPFLNRADLLLNRPLSMILYTNRVLFYRFL